MDNKGPPPSYGFEPPPVNVYPQVPQMPVVVQQRPQMNVGPESSAGVCPSCHASISTRVEKTSTTKTHLIALFLCVFMCWPCCLCPYCMDTCRATNHYCPSCGAFLGTYDH